jgi:hypothetical protein
MNVLPLERPKTATRHALMLEYANLYGDVNEATRAYLSGMNKAQLLTECFAAVRNDMRIVMREQTRGAEHRAFGSVEGKALDVLSDRAQLVDQYFCLEDGRWVLWLQATVEDHLDRAAWQRKLASGHVTDAEHHEQAADLISAAGVSCLEELPS